MQFPATLGDLLLRIYRLLEDLPYLDTITSSIAATPAAGDLTISVNDPTQWPVQSRFEIDSEVFLVKTNSGSNPITVTRAYESTVAAAHASGSYARRDPRFLRTNVVDALNVVLEDWISWHIPRLVWDSTTAGTFTPIRWIYTAPIDALAVRRVEWQLPGFIRFIPVPHTQLKSYPTDICSTGLGFEVTEHPGLPGRAVRVLYEKRWNELNADSDTVPDDFPDDGDDLLVDGTILRLAGLHQMPKYRLDEAVFYREQSNPLPTNFSQSYIQHMLAEWYHRVRQVSGRRPDITPQKVYIGTRF